MLRRLTKRLFWQPDVDAFVAPLRMERQVKLRLDRLPQGIDNSRIDVALSPQFVHHTHLFVRRDLVNEVAKSDGMAPSPIAGILDLQKMCEAYAGMMEAAIDRARGSHRLELIQLLQLGVVKFVILLVDQELARLRNQRLRAEGMNQQQSGKRSIEMGERLRTLARKEPALRYRILSKLFYELEKQESARLSKLRRSFLREAWPVPYQLLFNPLLRLTRFDQDALVMRHYPLLCTDRSRAERPAFDEVNRLVTSVFADFLPDWAVPSFYHPPEGVAAEGGGSDAEVHRSDQDILPGFLQVKEMLACSLEPEEYEQVLSSWLDAPSNIEMLLAGSDSDSTALEEALPGPVHPWRQPQWPGFQKRMLQGLLRGLQRSRLVRKALASYAVPVLYDELEGRVPARIIYAYLAGSLRRREVMRSLAEHRLPLGPVQTMKVLDRAVTGIRHMPEGRRRELLIRFLRDFAQFRRDAKLAFRAHRAMHRINVLSRPAELELSRTNGSLHEFLLQEEQQPELHQVRSHVVVKADVRGSTEMISQLRDRGLNPASHFSLNFFEPITKLLASYGAKKVFVEGDAVILSIFEYQDMPHQWLCVTHACGLARKIIQVVDAKNIKNREYDLPELELGLGIAFSNEAPTFLYDEEREIMISPAINRADQLSSCSPILRRSEFAEGLGRGIEVVSPGRELLLEKQSRDHMLRYNVNGIELDTPAFMKLQSELALQVVELEEMVYPGGSRFYTGRFADLQGDLHWLVVREAPVRVWHGGKPGTGEQHGHRFYQVVTDQDVIDRITHKLQAQETSPQADGQEPLQAVWNDGGEPRYFH